MIGKHTTIDGKTMLIAQMKDSHLENTIELYLKKIEGAKDILEAKVSVSKFRGSLYGFDDNTLAMKAKKQIRALTGKLLPYLAEAMLRGINFTEDLQRVFERKNPEEGFDFDFGDPVTGKQPKYLTHHNLDNAWDEM